MSTPTLRIAFDLNGTKRVGDVEPRLMLVDYLRDQCGLTGTRIGCSRGVCGSCTVLVDDLPRASCQTFAFQVDGCVVTTIEGVSRNGVLDPVQEAFVAKAAFQCGYCTSGMILLVRGLLAAEPQPDRATIVEWLSSNVCRCTGYALIIEAVEEAVRRLSGRAGAEDEQQGASER